MATRYVCLAFSAVCWMSWVCGDGFACNPRVFGGSLSSARIFSFNALRKTHTHNFGTQTKFGILFFWHWYSTSIWSFGCKVMEMYSKHNLHRVNTKTRVQKREFSSSASQQEIMLWFHHRVTSLRIPTIYQYEIYNRIHTKQEFNYTAVGVMVAFYVTGQLTLHAWTCQIWVYLFQIESYIHTP